MKLEYVTEFNETKRYYEENFLSLCPHCNHDVEFTIQYGKLSHHRLNFLVECPRCHEYSLICKEEQAGYYRNLIPSTEKILLPPLIEELSPKFCEIYQQTYQASNFGLNNLIGIGLSKAIEQLVYDYLVKVQGETPTYSFSKNIKLLKDFDDAVVQLTFSKFIRNDEVHPARDSEFTLDEMIASVEHLITLFTAKYSSYKTKKLLEQKGVKF